MTPLTQSNNLTAILRLNKGLTGNTVILNGAGGCDKQMPAEMKDLLA